MIQLEKLKLEKSQTNNIWIMGYKDENIKHRQGIGSEPKYKCPHCNQGLSINEPKFMVVCGKCKKIVKEKDIIVNNG